MCVAFGCFGQFKTTTYPIYNLKGEFVCYTVIGEQIPDSIPRGVYVVNGYKVSHIPQKPLYEKENEMFEINLKAIFDAKVKNYEIKEYLTNLSKERDLSKKECEALSFLNGILDKLTYKIVFDAVSQDIVISHFNAIIANLQREWHKKFKQFSNCEAVYHLSDLDSHIIRGRNIIKENGLYNDNGKKIYIKNNYVYVMKN